MHLDMTHPRQLACCQTENLSGRQIRPFYFHLLALPVTVPMCSSFAYHLCLLDSYVIQMLYVLCIYACTLLESSRSKLNGGSWKMMAGELANYHPQLSIVWF